MPTSRKIAGISRWLKQRGADVLLPTNEWEVLRWKANDVTSVIYRNKKGQHTYTGDAQMAVDAWRGHGTYEIIRGPRRKLTGMQKALLDRDGPDCFFCALALTDEDCTIEHLIPLSAGGPNHSSNLVLAHGACNVKAGSMSVAEKVRLRDELRSHKK